MKTILNRLMVGFWFVAFFGVCDWSQQGRAIAALVNGVDESARVVAVKNISIKEPRKDGWIFHLWDCDRQINGIVDPSGPDPFSEWHSDGVSRDRGNTGGFTKTEIDSIQFSRSLSQVAGSQLEKAGRLAFSSQMNRSPTRSGNSGIGYGSEIDNFNMGRPTGRDICAFNLMAVHQLAFTNGIERRSEDCDDGSSDSSYQRTPRINSFSEAPSREKDCVVTIAIIGGFALAAYAVGKGKIP